MATPHDTVTIVVSGEVALADFAKAIAHFDNLMKNLSTVSGSQDVDWVIENLEFSSTIATARGVGETERVKKVVHDYEAVGTALEQNTPIPFPDKVQRAAYGLRKIVRGKIESISLETASREAIIRPPSVAKGRLRVGEPLEPSEFHPPAVSLGSIHGRVQTLTNRGGLRFTLYDLLHDKAVSCYLKEGYEKIMRDAWGKLAMVSGFVTRDPLSGRPLSIRQISQVVEEGEELGDYRDAAGASPSLSDLSPEDAIRRLRDAQ